MSEDALVPTVVEPSEIVDYSGPRLTPQKKAAALQLAAGRKPNDICLRFNITPQTLRLWQKCPLFQAELNRLQRGQEELVLQMNETMQELCPIAVANVADIITRKIPTLDDVDPERDIKGSDIILMAKTQLEASFKVLATQGVSPVSKQSIKATTTRFNVEAQFSDLAEKWERKRRRAKTS